jgi:hypothetical protein
VRQKMSELRLDARRAATAQDAPCNARTTVRWRPLSSETQWLCLGDCQPWVASRVEWVASRVEWVRRRCGCCCASPVPLDLPAQHRARELCLEVLRLQQARWSMGCWVPTCLGHIGGGCHWPQTAGCRTVPWAWCSRLREGSTCPSTHRDSISDQSSSAG